MTRHIVWVFLVAFVFCFVERSDGLPKIPKIKLKPLLNVATDLVGDVADFTINEILNFNKFKSLFNKAYKTVDQENKALLNFLHMQRAVDFHNKKFLSGEVSFLRGICEYSDLTAREMNTLVNRFVKPGEKPKVYEPAEDESEFEEIEEEEEVQEREEEEYYEEAETDSERRKRSADKKEFLNYTSSGCIHPVQNQGLCGSCWSFSSAAAIEAHWCIKTGKLVKLSEQQLIDCNRDDEGDGNFGCGGGSMAVAFSFVEKFGGIALGSDYPYEANDTFKCRKTKGTVTVASHELLEPGDENLLKKKLIKHGPISIAVDASLPSFQSYKRGVYYDPKCSSVEVNHAVLLVGFGYDEETKQKYWLIKNTYGKTWGLNGYMMMARDRNNHCGVTEYAAYPIV